jgi:hypothetical protein
MLASGFGSKEALMIQMKTIGTAAILASAVFTLPAAAAPVDLSSWQIDGAGNWTIQSSAQPNDSAFQSLNSRPTMLFNGVDSQGLALSGTIEVQTASDDDWIGFVLGYDDGDVFGSNATTDYILVDWKQGTQGGWDAGMAISRVTGAIDTSGTDMSSDAWDHVGNVNFIQRAATLGNTGWDDNTEYLFEIVFTSTLIQVTVDGVEQFNLSGTFENGSFGFYNYSQPGVRYAGITEDIVPMPEATALAMLAFGLIGVAVAARKR